MGVLALGYFMLGAWGREHALHWFYPGSPHEGATLYFIFGHGGVSICCTGPTQEAHMEARRSAFIEAKQKSGLVGFVRKVLLR